MLYRVGLGMAQGGLSLSLARAMSTKTPFSFAHLRDALGGGGEDGSVVEIYDYVSGLSATSPEYPLPLPASHYLKNITSKASSPSLTPSPAYLNHFCTALDSPEMAAKIPPILESFRKRLISLPSRSASCVLKGLTRTGHSELAYQVLEDRQRYCLFPTLRGLNFLVYRNLIDSEGNLDKANDALKAFSLIKRYTSPNNMSYELLLYSMLSKQKNLELMNLEHDPQDEGAEGSTTPYLERLVQSLELKENAFPILPYNATQDLIDHLKQKQAKELLGKLKNIVAIRKRSGNLIRSKITEALE